jgi:hypothetical protein
MHAMLAWCVLVCFMTEFQYVDVVLLQEEKKEEVVPAVKVDAKLVKQLREQSGAGMMDCKKALAMNNNDLEAAAVWFLACRVSRSIRTSLVDESMPVWRCVVAYTPAY